MTPIEIMLAGNRDQKTLRALAGKLRGQKDIASLSMLSGDPTVGGFGQVLNSNVEDRVAQRLDEEQKQQQRDLTKGYYDQLAGQHADNQDFRNRTLAETMRHNQAMEQAAVLKKALGKKPPTTTAQKETAGVIEAYQNIQQIMGSFQDDYGSKIGFGEGSVSNMLGKTPLATDDQKSQAEWWSQYDLLYTLPRRNQIFGSALTLPEREAWDKANISPNSPPDVIRKGLERLHAIAYNALQRKAANDYALYDNEWADNMYGMIDAQDTLGDDEESFDYSEGAAEEAGVLDWSDL